MDFYPYETMFKGEVLIDGCRCHYLHDYYPTKIEKTNAHQKRVSNLIFRFKEGGHCGELVARILALCLKHAGFNGTKEDTVLIPIPASTRERQRKRFPVVCYYLSEWLGIADGFKAIWIEEDREQLKGKGKDKDILRNLQFNGGISEERMLSCWMMYLRPGRASGNCNEYSIYFSIFVCR